jgi:hypothetical protein
MRLTQREQIILMEAARLNPGPLADWLARWVQKQQEVGVNGTFDLSKIPVPGYPKMPATDSGTSQAYKDTKVEREAHLASIGYAEMGINQRRAIRRMGDTTIRVIEESDLIPENPNCWLGTHEVEEWKDGSEDHFLWRVIGTWASGQEIKKWGCEDCAKAIAKAHPEAEVHAFN